MRKLQRDEAMLVIIDVQERLMPVIHGADQVVRNIERLIRGAHILGIPVAVTEQYVKGLGPTVDSLRTALEETVGYEPVEKMCFSGTGCIDFMVRLEAAKRQQIILCGVEAHVCVHQTAMDLLDSDFSVYVAADAVSSRDPANREVALRRLESEGGRLTSTEMALFELTTTSGTDEFRDISRLVR